MYKFFYNSILISILGRIRADHSLFLYHRGHNHASYQDDQFEPLFLDEFIQNNHTNQSHIELCQGDNACLYDYLATGNAAFAESTRMASKMSHVIQQNLQPGELIWIV